MIIKIPGMSANARTDAGTDSSTSIGANNTTVPVCPSIWGWLLELWVLALNCVFVVRLRRSPVRPMRSQSCHSVRNTPLTPETSISKGSARLSAGTSDSTCTISAISYW